MGELKQGAENAPEKQFRIGKRVTLGFGPYKGIAGEIIEVRPALTVGYQLTYEHYKVRWDDPEHEISGWLSENDIKAEQ